MRNLKRALSLTLASVMLLGMMVVGSSAAGYSDVTDENNVEAIEVLQAIEVMVGDERGFGPERPVNRAEMAVVMGKLLNLDYNYYASSCPFNDVYDWARGYVGACYANKIVSGRGEGVYDPGATVTAVEAASMLMRALGYFQYANDVADGFELSTVRQGTKIGIFDNVGSSATEPMTRDQVAQMVLNALQTGMVEPDGQTINLTTPDGQVYTGKVNYVNVTSSKPFARAIGKVAATSVGSTNDGWIVDLGEQLYDGKLKLSDTTDAFERPARHWEYDGKDIGTYVKKELLRQEYTVKVTGKMLYDLITKPTIDDYDFTIAVDGIECVTANKDDLDIAYFTKGNLIRSNTEKVGETGNGVLTQVFVDPDNEHVYITVINTYLAKATIDYNAKKDEVDFEVWAVEDLRNSRTNKVLVKNTNEDDDAKTTLTVKGEDFAIEDVKDGDVVLVNVAEGEIKVILDPEVIDSTEISSFKDGDWVNAGGTQYDYADAIRYDPEVLDVYDDYNMKDTTYRVFLDKYGYALGVEIIDANDQYVFVTGIDKNTHNLTNKTAEGNMIFTDGTMKTAKIDMKNSVAADGKSQLPVVSLLNTWCKYTVNSDGIYTLTEVANDDFSFTHDDRGNPYSNENKTDKIGQGRDLDITVQGGDNNDQNPTAPADFMTLDKSHIYLSSKIDGYKTVYTNDDTVFITATVGEIEATEAYDETPFTDWDALTTKRWVAAIDDVDSVATGARNVNLKVWNAAKVFIEGFKAGDLTQGKVASVNSTTNPTAVTSETALRKVASGAYTLFSDEGYVIATVVVGEDDGSTSNYAYVTSGDAKRESYDKANDEYTWEREVIVNGKLIDLVEKKGSNPAIRGMTKGNWYEVKYKADGTVKSVTNLSKNDIDYPMPKQDFDNYLTGESYDDGKYIQAIEDYEAAVDENDTVLLWDNLTDVEYEVSVEGNTLQVETASGKKNGFSVSGDCKVVLIQDKKASRGGWTYMDDIEEFSATGTAGLKAMVKALNDNEAFVGFIGAVFEGKLATSVVVYDKTETEVDEGDDFDGGEDVYAHTEANGDITITTSKVLTARQIADVVKSHLNDSNIETVTYNTSGTATIKYTDGLQTTLNVTISRVADKKDVAGAEIMNKVQDAIESAGTPYGTITIDGNTMTADGGTGGTYVDDTSGTSKATKDFKNFLTALHTKGAKEIKFGVDTYKWNAEATNPGGSTSKWVKNGAVDGTTLVTDVVSAIESNFEDVATEVCSASVDLVVDGANLHFVITCGGTT